MDGNVAKARHDLWNALNQVLPAEEWAENISKLQDAIDALIVARLAETQLAEPTK